MSRIRPLALLIVALVLVLAACSSGMDTAADAEAPQEEEAASARESRDAAAGGDRDADTADTADTADAADDGDVGLGGGSDEALPPVPATATVAARSDRLIKEGTMTIAVGEGGFEADFQRVVEAARRLGGSVVSSSSTSREDDAGTSGSVTIRVPVDRYEELLVGVGDVGEVRRRDITTKDVTAEFTDLSARLRHARAQERFYLGLLEDAQGVQDAIAVQQQLDGIQSTIERLQGSVDVLEDRTSFSTLTVELVEPGAAPVVPVDERPQIATYVATAQDAFVTVVGSALVVGVALTPLVLPALALLLLWRGFGRRARPATVATKA